MENQESNINDNAVEKEDPKTEKKEELNTEESGLVNETEVVCTENETVKETEVTSTNASEETKEPEKESSDDHQDATKEFAAVTIENAFAEDISEETKEFSAVSDETGALSEGTAKKKKKTSKNSPVRIIILVLCLGVFAFSGYKIVSEIIDGQNTQKMSDDLWETVRGGENQNDDENHDDINVPPAPIDPNVSGYGITDKSNDDNKTETVENNTESEYSGKNEEPNDPGSETSSDPSEENQTDNSQTADPSDSTTEPSPSQPEENDNYDDRTYEEELQEQQQITEEEDTQYYVSRPSRDRESYEPGVVIRPEEIKMSSVSYLRSSNLKSLLSVNKDTVGWIFIPGSKEEAKGMPIDTAIVQTTDNEFYLDHTFDKQENINGWVYADYRCNTDSITSNYNTVIYGHARSYKMFGGLKDLNEAVEWYSNGYNHFIKINTFNDETVWQIFSWYETDIYFDYIKTDFEDSNDFIRFAYEVQSKNQMEGVFESFEFSENDRILTLSTCKGFDRAVRIAVHAKLVKRNPLN